MAQKILKATMTFHFPFDRTNRHPEATVIIRRPGKDKWIAGYSICSSRDNFSKEVGRLLAFRRLMNKNQIIRADNPEQLIHQLKNKFNEVWGLHCDNFSFETFRDIEKIRETISNMRVM